MTGTFAKEWQSNISLIKRTIFPLIPTVPKQNFAVQRVSSEVQRLSKSEVKLERENACIEPCGCFARLPNDCVNHSYLSPLKRGPNADQKLRNTTLCLPREDAKIIITSNRNGFPWCLHFCSFETLLNPAA
ncbi:unnamed protein product [Ceratitis capitata]|uniref:(Mediterranean fruit fly) hypothetical protein n=1 Tax=Ceratitis capitata TaxID=7213 RepID=A0A811U238_CERCA|nr:unnamed protein product [Ceratitis capitata]